ncbi:hypothetical protein Bbelb_104430 [Branchiostoma belcheri]|nr:hypothetical protein Bbelb_104430 [Branchiostoma belcheri]
MALHHTTKNSVDICLTEKPSFMANKGRLFLNKHRRYADKSTISSPGGCHIKINTANQSEPGVESLTICARPEERRDPDRVDGGTILLYPRGTLTTGPQYPSANL